MAPLKIGANTLVAMSGMTIPTKWERPVPRLAATGSTRYPSVLAAFNTRLARDGTTIELVAGLSARDTVETCTPATSATCFIVGCRRAPLDWRFIALRALLSRFLRKRPQFGR